MQRQIDDADEARQVAELARAEAFGTVAEGQQQVGLYTGLYSNIDARCSG